MREVVFLCLLASASAFLPEFHLSDESIHIVAQNSKPSEAAITPCLNNGNCLNDFNTKLGLDPTLTYLNGTLLFSQINTLLQTNTTEIVKICNQRTQFYQCLGSSYYPCMNLFYILNQPGADYQNAFDYTRTFSGLDFLCNAGFEEVVKDWSCLHPIQTTMAYKKCMNGFSDNVNPSILCPQVQTTGQCLNDAYKAACADLGAGFFGCENFRYTFDQSCYGLRCVVG